MKLQINFLVLLFLHINIFQINCFTATRLKNFNKFKIPYIFQIDSKDTTIVQKINEEEKSTNFWTKNAQKKLIEKISYFGNLNQAKNIIFFLGDGMSIPTLAASRIYMGQKDGQPGEESELSFEKFPFTGLSKTYCIDKQVADSACSATAYLCGVKANFLTIGVNGKVKVNDCKSAQTSDNQVSSIASWAQQAGKSTGIVTTTRVTHASPAGNYAHTSNRAMESDLDISKMNLTLTKSCEDIATQLVFKSPGDKFKVILGGGRKKFLPNSISAGNNEYGERMDGINLIGEWKNQKKNANSKYVANREDLKNVDYENTDYLLGLFNSNHMKYNLDNDDETEPSLSEMTEAAIKMMKNNPKGFYLFVEGGKIDIAHHDNLAQKSLDETVEFSKAIEKAVQLTSQEDTLIIVTADHAHTMSISGYSNRGNNILGLNTERDSTDKLPYPTLSYANGMGYWPEINKVRHNYSNDDLTSKSFLYPAGVPMKYETHGGDDVAVFALGPWAKLFSGVYEQNTIPHLIAFTSCIGDGITLCSKAKG